MPSKVVKIDSFYGTIDLNDELKFKLGLGDDWKIVSVLTMKTNPAGLIWERHSLGSTIVNIDYVGSNHKCPYCSSHAKVNQYRFRELLHVRGYGFDTILRIKTPQLLCGVCGKTSVIPFPIARPGMSYTIEFEKWALRLMMDKNISKASKEASVSRTMFWEILEYRVNESLPYLDLSDVSMITIDETSFGKKHDYATVVSDQNRRLVFMCKGKGKNSLALFCQWLVNHGGNPKNISVVTADMSSAFEAGTEDYLPKATLVFDKFHVIKLLNDDMNQIYKRMRRETTKDGCKPSFTKFTVLKHEDNMDDREKGNLESLRMANPQLALAYDMKEAFFGIYDQKSKEDAKAFFMEWWLWVSEEGCRELKARAYKLNEKLDKILAYYDHEMTNAFAEGLNSKIQKAKSDGCGYRILDNFIHLCYFRFGNIRIRFDENEDGIAHLPSSSAGERK